MNIIYKKFNIILILAFLVQILSFSRINASFEDIEIGAKATSLAGAFVSQVDDISGIFYNPAGLMKLKRSEVFASYEKKYIGLTDNSSISDQVAALGVPTKYGNIGLAYHLLSLDSLYKESMIKFGYSRAIGDRIYSGLSVSSLRIGYGETLYTKVNPVFDNGYNKTGISVDAGLLYVRDFIDFGISILNANSPDMGLKYENKVPMKVHTGVSLKQRILNLNIAGTVIEGDYRFKTGIETWLYKRKLALRGGMNVGSSKYRNATLGMGYKDNHYEVDYAVIYPLSGISSTYGSHQLSFIYRFGDEEELDAFTWRDLIELAKADMQKQKKEVKKPEQEKKDKKDKKEKEDVITPEKIADAQDLAIKSKGDFSKGLYAEAVNKLMEAKKILPDDAEINTMLANGKIISNVVPAVTGSGKRRKLIRAGVESYMGGNGKSALNNIRYASQLYPEDGNIQKLKRIVEKKFSDIAGREKLLPGINLVDQKLQQALELIYGQKYVAAIALCMEATDLEPKNVLALMRMGSAYWAMGHTNKAKDVWKRALRYDPENEQLREFLNMKKPAGKAVKKEAKPEPKKADAKILKEYENGVKYYKRVKTYGAGKDTLKSILRRMINKFSNSGIDISYLHSEYKKYK
jgi:tetratricopeptide (TPR) repeat protein